MTQHPAEYVKDLHDNYLMPVDYHEQIDSTSEAMPSAAVRMELRNHVCNGYPVGGFTKALLNNNLSGAVFLGDHQSQKAIYTCLMWMFNHMPADCHGSPSKVAEWQSHLGLKGWSGPRRSDEKTIQVDVTIFLLEDDRKAIAAGWGSSQPADIQECQRWCFSQLTTALDKVVHNNTKERT
jgi:hypothetical protein